MVGGVILTPLWCWTFHKDGVLVVWRWHFKFYLAVLSPLEVFHSTVQNASLATLTGQHSQLLVKRVAHRLCWTSHLLYVDGTSGSTWHQLKLYTWQRLKCLAQVGIHPQSTSNLHDISTSLPTSLNLFSNTDDIIFAHSSSAGSNPVGPTTSVGSSTYSGTPIREYTVLYIVNIVIITVHLYIQWQFSTVVSPSSRPLDSACVLPQVCAQTDGQVSKQHLVMPWQYGLSVSWQSLCACTSSCLCLALASVQVIYQALYSG